MANYALSSDGGTVVRLTPTMAVDGSGFDTSLLSDDFSVTFDEDLDFTLTRLDAAGAGASNFGAVIQGTTTGDGTLDWIQIVETDAPLGGNTSPYLDNGPAGNDDPFYPVTTPNDQILSNRLGDIPDGIYFYDFPSRRPSDIGEDDVLNWTGTLYPVRVGDMGALEIGDGFRWGWEAKPAGVGTTDAVFSSALPGTATTTGLGTSSFTWGVGVDSPPSSLEFTGGAFDVEPGEPFVLGRLDYFNGTIEGFSGASSVDLQYSIDFTNVPEENTTGTVTFELVNSPNFGDPQSAADEVLLEEFGVAFNVLEDATASANMIAVLTPVLDVEGGNPGDATEFGTVVPIEGTSFGVQIVGFSDTSEDGFVEIDLSRDNFLVGTEGRDTLDGERGDDRILGRADDDVLIGGDGDDSVEGGAGDDRLEGNGGNDTLLGGADDDGLIGGDGNDVLNGGDGDDNLASGLGDDDLTGGTGDDFMGGGEGDDSMSGEAGNDTLGGGFGNDTIDGGEGDDVVAGGAGLDLIDGGDGDDVMGASFGDDTVTGGDGSDDLGGGTGQDVIEAGAGNDSVGGGEGDDTVTGGAGDDFLAGGGRDDAISGGDGADTINGGGGSDTMAGDAGADVFIWNEGDAGVTDYILGFEDGTDLIRLAGVENAPGSGLQGRVDALDIGEATVNDEASAVLTYDGQTIFVQGVTASELTVDDFIFT